MTRINAGIPVTELGNRHLLAEHREITRIPNLIHKGKYSLEGMPDKFTLGKGHVKFFYNKLKYLHLRYLDLFSECRNRNFNIRYNTSAFYDVPPLLYNNWEPTQEARKLVEQRIAERLNNSLKK